MTRPGWSELGKAVEYKVRTIVSVLDREADMELNAELACALAALPELDDVTTPGCDELGDAVE